jgi:two-component system, NarL family, sensor histidine kinase UhpB
MMRHIVFSALFVMVAAGAWAQTGAAPVQPAVGQAQTGVGQAQTGVGQAQTAVADSLKRVIALNHQDKEENYAMNLLATEYSRTDMAAARALLYRSLELANHLNYDAGFSSAYGLMVSLQMNIGRPDSAAWYLEQLRKVAERPGQRPDVVTNYYGVAGLYYKKQGLFKEAVPFLIRSLQSSIANAKAKPTTKAATDMAGQALNLGNTYIQLGEYKNALSYHLQALKAFEEVANQRGLSFTYQSIGSDFLRLGQLGPALQYIRKAIVLKRELNDKRGLATSSGDLADAFLQQRQFDSSLFYYRQAQATFHEMKLTADEAKVDLAMGKVYRLKKDPVNAQLYYQNARALAAPIKDSGTLAALDVETVALQTKIKQQENDERKLMSSLRMSIGHGDKNMEIQNYQFLADYYAGNGQYEKALDYTHRYQQEKDSLLSDSLALQISRMEKQYNLDKKEQEITLLKKDQLLNQVTLQRNQAELQRQKNLQIGGIALLALLVLIAFLIVNRYRVLHQARRIIDMERMRNDIARDLHDDIGSMLTSINILSKLTLEQAGGEPLIRNNLQKIKDRSGSIMESMSDIVWAINPKNDTVAKMIYRMKEFAAEMLEPINVPYQFTESGALSTVRLDVRKRKDFYLLFKEAINNAAKYSQCSRLQIDLRQEQQLLRLEVADNGKGFDPLTARQGNGLQNMQSRASAMEGTVAVRSGAGKGTVVVLEVPIV